MYTRLRRVEDAALRVIEGDITQYQGMSELDGLLAAHKAANMASRLVEDARNVLRGHEERFYEGVSLKSAREWAGKAMACAEARHQSAEIALKNTMADFDRHNGTGEARRILRHLKG